VADRLRGFLHGPPPEEAEEASDDEADDVQAGNDASDDQQDRNPDLGHLDVVPGSDARSLDRVFS